MAGERGTIVVIEDEEDILDVVDYNLSREGFVVERAADGRAGLALVCATVPSLVILDLMLPGLDGVEVCREIRANPATRRTPVIMLTAKDGESDVVLGLGVGADDYVTKPFSPSELVARVKAVLRRHGDDSAPAAGDTPSTDGEAEPGERVERGLLVVDRGRHEVVVGGADVRLTRTELNILHVLASHPGRVFSRERLVRRAIGDDAWVTERTIDVHVRAIRKKLGERAGMVETVRGVGYRFSEAAAAAATAGDGA